MMRPKITETICPSCETIRPIYLLDPSDSFIVDIEPCHECKARFDALGRSGFVVFVIRDDFENQINASVWSYFQGVHVLDPSEASRIFVGIDLKSGYGFVSASLAKRLGINEDELS